MPGRRPPVIPLPQPPGPPPHGPEPRRWTAQLGHRQRLLPLPLSQQHQPHPLLPFPLLQSHLFLLLQRNGTQPGLPGWSQDGVTTPRANQRGGGNEETGTSPFTPKLSLPLLCSSLPHFYFFPPPLAAAAAAALLFSFSPDLSMPKIHRMKEERGREGGERGGQGEERGRSKPKIFIYPKKQMGKKGNVGPFFFFFFLCQ